MGKEKLGLLITAMEPIIAIYAKQGAGVFHEAEAVMGLLRGPRLRAHHLYKIHAKAPWQCENCKQQYMSLRESRGVSCPGTVDDAIQDDF